MQNNRINEIKRRILNKNNKPISKKPTKASPLIGIEEYKMQKKGESFIDGIYKYLREHNMKASILYNKAYVDRRVYSKMANKDYMISKNTAICFCIAMELSLFETQEMLKRVGYALSDFNDFDIVIAYCIENKIYDIVEINGYLCELKMPLLGQRIK